PELGLPPLVTHAVTTDDDSWRDSWKEFFKPLRPGDGRLLIRPSWIAPREDDPSLEIILDPGRAFGTGQHESTSLCLEILASLHSVNTIGPARVLDLGCGSGILALAAARFWPQAEVVAIDVDEEAVETTRENARDNGLEHRVVAARGTPDDLRDHFDLVLANIRPSVLIPSAAQIAAATRGTLVMSGILDEEFTEVIAAYRPLGFSDALPPQREGGWSAACLERR
ncbi:MAG: 50S ribosomal protein L11 methyltransferase, partial [Nannocystaceae bacterium]